MYKLDDGIGVVLGRCVPDFLGSAMESPLNINAAVVVVAAFFPPAAVGGINRIMVKGCPFSGFFGKGQAVCQIVVLTSPTIEIVGFLGGAARFIAKPCLKQRVMRFPTVRYGCSV